MINVKYPRRGFVVEEVIEACKTEGCTAEKFVVSSWENYGEDNFNNLTYGQSKGEHSTSDYTEGICPECRKPVVYKDYFVITSDANALKIAFEAYYYARDVLNAPFPEGESLIATDAEYSYKYAKDILKAPFLLGEAAIATDAKYSFHYAKDILKAPFLLGEKIIATNKYLYKEYKELFPEPQAKSDYDKALETAKKAFYYAYDVLKSPFPEGEAAIATNAHWSYLYALDILKAPFPLGEPAIATSEEYSYCYALYVLKAPFPLGEPAIAFSYTEIGRYLIPIFSYKYARDVLKAPFPLGEAFIATHAEYSYKYARDVLKAPFTLGEAEIATDAYYYKEYKRLFPEPQAPTIEEPQAPDSMNIVSGFYLKEKTSMSDKQKRKQKQKDVIKSTFLTLIFTLEDIIGYDKEGGTYFFVGCLFEADRILKSIHDLMETFPNLTKNLVTKKYSKTYLKVKSYMDEYFKKLKEENEKEKQEKEKPRV